MADDSVGQRIAAYRRRRGLSQAALAGLVGRSESWLSQVERGVRGVDRLSVLLDLARLLHVEVADLTSAPWSLAPNGGPRVEGINEVRSVLTRYTAVAGDQVEAPSIEALRASSTAVHVAYQGARYEDALRALPHVLLDADAALIRDGDAVSPVYIDVYAAASRLLTKLGVGDLGAVTADRAAMAAARTESLVAQGVAMYQVVTALLRGHQVEDAERVAMRTAERLLPRSRADSPTVVSVCGALWLIAGVIAARRADRWEAARRLDQADELATLLGRDANLAWTGFGPTNVGIHRVSVAAELGDPAGALEAASTLDVDRLPVGLTSRRAQVHLDLAWANAQRRRDAEATLDLLAAERVAPEVIGYNVVAREIVREMLARAKGGRADALRALATRCGVLAS